MTLSFVEKGFYADVVGPCSHNHEDSCGEYARRVAAGSLETIDNLRAENAQLRGLACLICGRDTPCGLDTNKDNGPNWPGSPCTFDPSPVDVAKRFMQERDGYKALAERGKEALEAELSRHVETPSPDTCSRCRDLMDIIAMTPAEALEEKG